MSRYENYVTYASRWPPVTPARRAACAWSPPSAPNDDETVVGMQAYFSMALPPTTSRSILVPWLATLLAGCHQGSVAHPSGRTTDGSPDGQVTRGTSGDSSTEVFTLVGGCVRVCTNRQLYLRRCGFDLSPSETVETCQARFHDEATCTAALRVDWVGGTCESLRACEAFCLARQVHISKCGTAALIHETLEQCLASQTMASRCPQDPSRGGWLTGDCGGTARDGGADAPAVADAGGAACGGPGQPCCAGGSCDNGGCCMAAGLDRTRRCAPAGSVCSNDNICIQGTCGSCGGPGQECCANSNCTAPRTLCASQGGLFRCTPCGGTDQACCPGQPGYPPVCTAVGTGCSAQGICEACGPEGKTCCDTGTPCVAATACAADKLCRRCGAPGQICCAAATCASGGGCNTQTGRCEPCGAAGQLCCDDTCTTARTICEPPTDANLSPALCRSCGRRGEACCAGKSCDLTSLCDVLSICVAN